MAKSQSATPFWSAVSEYVRSKVYPFHTPAHKQGRFGDRDFLAAMGQTMLLDLDPPVLTAGTAPADAVLAAERLTAQAYGADRSFFLVNGSTQGIQAGILALARPGEPIVVPRHSHRSVAAGLALAGADPLFISTPVDPRWGIPLALTARDVSAAVHARRTKWLITQHDAAVNALVTHPNYWGLAEPVRAIGEVIASTGGVLMCDEAHGAHLPFMPSGPAPALALGASIAVQSPHKMLGSLVQSAWMHIKGGGVDLQRRLSAAVSLLGTSSPSFLLLSSLDTSRRWAIERGRQELAAAADMALEVRAQIARFEEIACLTDDDARDLGYAGLDPLKLTIGPRGDRFNGLDVARFLREEHGIQVEMANPLYATLILSPGDTKDSGRRLVEALSRLVVTKPGGNAGAPSEKGDRDAGTARELFRAWPTTQPLRAMSLREAVFAGCREVPLTSSAGLVAASTVAPYPPGIPVLYPGERIESHVVQFLAELAAVGVHIDGLGRGASGALVINVVEYTL